ncbi:YraN family protein [Fuchsiella alkaliacetigena]|uniref:YraN family protein n=1 Tax=Fuchsiella alkaliacetigena TaxID=957042 RepID=UPI00200ADA1C|nr:YraN family protein [Fuchsiella alkaliacetigena]MCK8823570.1 YraN family protein [Fuchsiella alkaliacetigena]
MLTRQELGQLGEKLAVKYLQQQGYKIVEQNYYCRLGEIDIIAFKDDYLVFIEVKTKRNQNFGSPWVEVNCHKQQKIHQVARHYISRQGYLETNFRFDVIGVFYSCSQDYQLSHLENAFSV